MDKLEEAKKRIAEARKSKRTTLDLSGCGIKDLRSDVPELFEGMERITYLILNNNEISDITPLSYFKYLEVLDLSKNKITNIDPIKDLTRIINLNFDDNEVKDIKPLEELINLLALSFKHNAVSDVSPISFLSKLGSLDIYNNLITDISTIGNIIVQLKTFEWRKNPLTNPPREIFQLGFKQIQKYFIDNPTPTALKTDDHQTLNSLNEKEEKLNPSPKHNNLEAKKMIFISANPRNTNHLQITKELDEILKYKNHNSLDVDFIYADTIADIIEAVAKKNYDILYFSGHGEPEGIILGHKIGTILTWASLDSLLLRHSFELVFINAAYSSEYIKSSRYYSKIFIGINMVTSEDAARAFAVGFYKNLTLPNYDYKKSFDLAQKSIQTTYPLYKGSYFYINLGEKEGKEEESLENPLTEKIPKEEPPTPKKPNHHRYLADDSSGIDYLDITNDVNAFANLMVQKDLPMPMAVGLFGHWGSGKSFFMSKLYDRIEDLKGKSTGNRHLRHIVQVRFNAWHYAEQNLWHSITAIIFGELVGFANKGKNKNPIELYEELKNKSKSFEEEIAEKEAEKEQLTQAQREREIQLLKNLPYELTSSFWEELKKNEDVQAVLKEWGILDAEFSKAQTLIEAKRSEWGIVREDLKTIFHSPQLAFYFFVKKAFFPFMIAGLIWAALLLDWEVMKTQVSKMVAFVLSVLSILYPFIPYIEKRLAGSKAIISSIANDIKNIKKENQAALDAIDKEIEKTRARKEKTDQTLDIWRKGQRLLDFINNPDLVDKYTKLLGHITMIRKDFEALKSESNFISAVVEESEEKFNIERIILYIDDLDRCEEDKVVEVLEIVHLLMGLENGLFVTVVGVDPRWLVRSLHTKYSKLLSNKEKSANAFDYLEKIFQIPFRIQALSRETTEKLLKGLVQLKTEPKTTTTKEEKSDISNAPKIENTVEEHEPIITVNDIPDTKTENQEKEQTKTVETEPEIFSLEMTQDELNWMSALTEKIGKNPRSVKRFVNIYSILRVHEDTPAYSDENQTDFKCILLILSFLFDPKCQIDFERSIGEEDFNTQILTETLKKTFEGVTTELFNKYLPLVRKYSFPEIEKEKKPISNGTEV